MSKPRELEKKVFNLLDPASAREAYETALQLCERGEVFEVVINYDAKIIEITRFFAQASDWKPKLHVTFSTGMVRIMFNGRMARFDAERILVNALIDKARLFQALEEFIKLPLLVDVRVW